MCLCCYLFSVRKNDAIAWSKLQFLFDVSDTKVGCLCLEVVPVNADDVMTSSDVCKPIVPLKIVGCAADLQTSANHDEDLFAPVKAKTFMGDFSLTFFGSVALDGKAPCASLSRGLKDGLKKETEDVSVPGPSLPWQLFGTGFDNLLSSEVVCPAWLVPAKKMKLTPIQKRKQDLENGASRSGIAGLEKGDASDAEDVSSRVVTDALGINQPKSKAKAKAKTRGKAKAKGKPKAKAGIFNNNVTFVDEPVFL